MKTLNNIIVTTTIIMVAIMALLTSFTASANVYEDRLKQAFDDIINAVPLEDLSQMHTAYTDPETGIKEGQLDVVKFTIDSENMDLINNAKRVYEQVNGNSTADIYTLWWNDNDDGTTFQGYRLYYSPENAITVGIGCDHCYTVGFLTPDDKQHRTTYTIEWSEDVDDGISGRIVTTYASIKPKATDGMRISSVVMSPDDYDKYMAQFQAGMEKYQEGMEKYRSAMEKAQGSLEKAQGALSRLSDGQGHSYSFSSSSKTDAKSWMQKLLFYVEKLQDNGSAHYLYLSKLYELCKDTEGLDQTDLKIGMQQLASIYKKLKAKNELKENELQFLESMVDLLESKIKK
ncbi:MAG: hypothetical protein IJJ83_10205 [Muribaculaceae bacterium]|nr:hypothetical protein [Muribaculaceae bacterium]